MRALRFAQVMEEQGVRVSGADITAFVDARRSMAGFDPLADEIRVPTAAYLIDARLLVRRRSGVTLTPAGRAVLASASGSDTVEVTGRMTDPFFYAEVLERIDGVPNSMIVDPYIHPDDVGTLLRLPGVRRILTRGDAPVAKMNPGERRRLLPIVMSANPAVQLRYAANGSEDLHDRLVLPAAPGPGVALGTTLGARHFTVVTGLSEHATGLLRRHYETVWKHASTVEPLRDA